MKPKSILLNGPSSAGKSSTARAICDLDNRYFHFASDAFVWGLPTVRHYHPREKCHKVRGRRADPSYVLNLFARNAAVKIASGSPLIIDTICLDEWTPLSLFDRIPKKDLLLVGLTPNLETVITREKIRGDREYGMTADHFARAHRGISYDITIDNEHLTLQQTAKMILGAL